MAEKTLEIAECDEAGNVTATFVASATQTSGTSRIDVILPENTKSLWQKTLDVFLPAGYPHSVTDDYLEYQIYDSLQAFSSSIAGLLSSRAVLSSVGVGDSTASPTAALLLSILQETAGRIATILFAHRFGTSLEPERKMYRLLADILNDIAFVLDCLSPGFPKVIRVIILSFSSVLRALCGVAAGSAKASLSAHFAKWGNLGELNAKDSSQETVISLLGMLVGTVVVSWVTTPIATWTTLILLLSIHLETNRRAVRAVKMRTMNRQRATLVFHHLRKGHVPTPTEIAAQERVFEWDGVLRESSDKIVGYCDIGASMTRFVEVMSIERNRMTMSATIPNSVLLHILGTAREMRYMMWFGRTFHEPRLIVVVNTNAKPTDLLIAWWQALQIATELRANQAEDINVSEGPFQNQEVDLLERCQRSADALFQKHRAELKAKGWDVDEGALEVPSSSRVKFIA